MASEDYHGSGVLSRFSALDELTLDGPFALEAEFKADPNDRKVNLVIGAYRDENGNPWKLPSIIEAKKRLKIEAATHEYIPLQGLDEFLMASRVLLFGKELIQIIGNSIDSVQTVAGTGANSLSALFLSQHLRPLNIWLPDPTWDNHCRIWKQNAPQVHQRRYPYYNDISKCFDIDGMIQLLELEAKPNDVILLHACAHNPTGVDPTQEQWKLIATVCEKKQLFVLFDSAYQGFASGELKRDAWAVRHFALRQGIEMAVCQSFSKNMGLYGERVGALHVVASRADSTPLAGRVQGHLVAIQRGLISMPPALGARIASHVLSNASLLQAWKDDLKTLSRRISDMRRGLHDGLIRLNTPGDWHHIATQTGMFSYTGLTKMQVTALKQKYHIYMLDTGRISLSGLNPANLEYVAEAIDNIVTSGIA